jgi:hypothetical protein
MRRYEATRTHSDVWGAMTVPSEHVRERRSALFVDFDNVYSGLAETDRPTADLFGTDPAAWVAALSRGADDEGPFRRRFLIRVCYLNPVTHERFRPFFTRSGFRVVDCPPLTVRQKNSADIHMVLDIVDALAHPAGYDDFVLASADADFTPVMMRLRAHDRRTTIVIGGPAAAAYLSVCDAVIMPAELAVALRPTTAAEPRDGASTNPATPSTATAAGGDLPLVRAAILAAVRAAPRPVVTAAVAQAALAVNPTLSENGWAGAGKFSAFIARDVPELQLAASPAPGYLFDPARHTASDVPNRQGEPRRAQLGAVAAQVSLVTDAPPLSSDQYAALFQELAADVDAHGFGYETAKRVRDATHLREQPISRRAVTSVLQGLTYAGKRPQAGVSAHELAGAWLGCLRDMCTNAQMQLGQDEQALLEQWITGAL